MHVNFFQKSTKTSDSTIFHSALNLAILIHSGFTPEGVNLELICFTDFGIKLLLPGYLLENRLAQAAPESIGTGPYRARIRPVQVHVGPVSGRHTSVYGSYRVRIGFVSVRIGSGYVLLTFV